MRMTKAEKRVEIAKDVLKQIKAKKYKPECGVWFQDSNGVGLNEFIDWSKSKVLDAKKDIVDKLEGTCSVCALGSLFVSAIDKYNHTKLDTSLFCADNEVFTSIDGNNPLNKWFTTRQLLLIENTFEYGLGAWSPDAVLNKNELDYWYETVEFAIGKYNYKYPSSTNRLKAIMNNIIRNKGTFVLPGVKL